LEKGDKERRYLLELLHIPPPFPSKTKKGGGERQFTKEREKWGMELTVTNMSDVVLHPRRGKRGGHGEKEKVEQQS